MERSFAGVVPGSAFDFNGLIHLSNRPQAMARWNGIPLPSVELSRIGERYYAHAGHHRLAVARVLRQEDIEALVTVWETASLRA